MNNLTLRSARMLSLLSTLVLAAACGDDKGDTDGGSGTAGTGTAGTDSPTTTPTSDPTADPTAGLDGKFCQEQCTVTDDCKVNGVDTGLTCTAGRCGGGATGCEDNNDCQVLFSGWITTCATQAECPGQACVDIGGGAGRCAAVPSDFLTCEMLMQTEIMMPPIEGGADVTVCANTDYTCKDGACQNPCEANTDCALLPGYPQCNVGTGNCECTSDDDCKATMSPAASVCTDGVCGCGTDEDCAGAANADVCNSGFCGCSDASVCTTKGFDGTMSVCEGF